MDEITKQILKHYQLEVETRTTLNKVIISDKNKKDLLFTGFFNNYFCHFKSISILVEQKLYNTAFALIRILFENLIRSLYMYETFESEKIDNMYRKMYNNQNWKDFERPVTIDSMCKKLDELYTNGANNYFKKIKDNAYSPMNDYTHTGANQIARNFDDNGKLTSKFDKEMIFSTLEDIYSLTKVFATIYFEKIGLSHNIITKEYLEKFSEEY